MSAQHDSPLIEHEPEYRECPWCKEEGYFGLIGAVGIDMTQDFLFIGRTKCCGKLFEMRFNWKDGGKVPRLLIARSKWRST